MSRKEHLIQEKRAQQAAKIPRSVSIPDALAIASQLYQKGELA